MNDEIYDLLSSYDQLVFTDYKEWKIQLDDVVDRIIARLLTLGENALSSFLHKVEAEAQIKEKTESQTLILQSYLRIYLITYFPLNRETLRPFCKTLYRFLSSNNKLVVHATVKLLDWIALQTNFGLFVFNKPISMAKEWLQNSNMTEYKWNSLIILKFAKAYSLNEVSTIIQKCFSILVPLATSESPIFQKYSLKLLIFYFQRGYVSTVNGLDQKLFSLCVEILSQHDESKAYGALKLLYELFKLFDETYVYDLDILHGCLIYSIDNFSPPNDVVALDIATKILKRRHSFFEIDKIISNVMSKCQKFPILIPKLITMVHEFSKSIEYEPLLQFISDYSQKNRCNGNDPCIYELLAEIFKLRPNINIEITKFKHPDNCCHFIGCIKQRPDLLEKEVVDYFLKVIDGKNASLSTLTNAIYFSRIFPQYFYKNLQELFNVFTKLNHFADYFHTEQIREQFLLAFSELHKEEAQCHILDASLFDPSKRIRILAINNLIPTPSLASPPRFLQLLNDPSFKVRRAAIKLVSNVVDFNPLEIMPLVIDYTHRVVDLIVSTSDAQQISKFASLLPQICEYCQWAAKPCIDSIIKVFVDLLSAAPVDPLTDISGLYTDRTRLDFPISTANNTANSLSSGSGKFSLGSQSPSLSMLSTSMNYQGADDISPFSHTSLTNEFLKEEGYFMRDKPVCENLLIENSSMKEPLRSKLFWMCRSKYVNKRDAYLTQAISNLGELVEPYLTIILGVYETIFKTRTSETILIDATKSLINLASKTYNGLNIRLRCPKLINPLSLILTTTQNEELIIEILKLFGSAFDIIDVFQTQSISNHSMSIQTGITKPSFFTDFVIMHLLHHFFDYIPDYYKTIAMIFDGDPHNSARYTPSIYPLFIRVIDKGNWEFRDKMFPLLEIICTNCENEIIPLLHESIPILTKFIDTASCVHFLTTLSYHLGSSFIPTAVLLFMPLVSNLIAQKYHYFKNLAKLITSCIIYQNQPLEMFMDVIERRVFEEKFIRRILKSLLSITHSIDVRLQKSRIVIYANKYLEFDLAQELLYSLCICGEFSCFLVKGFFESHNLEYNSAIEEIANKQFKTIDDVPWIKNRQLKIAVPSLSTPYKQRGNYFKSLQYPTEAEIPKWLSNLNITVVKISPSSSIRACSPVLAYFPSFSKRLFPIAFLSCWSAADESDRCHFANIISRILFEHRHVDKFFIELVQLLDNSLMPMNVNYVRVAELSDSHQFSLFLLQRMFMNNPNDMKIIRMLLDINLKIGHNESTRALLDKYKDKLTDLEVAKYYGNLGNWEKALEIYKAEQNQLPEILHCLRNLGRYKEILKYEEEFWTTPYDKQQECAGPIAWAYSKKGNNDQVNKFIETFFTKQWNTIRFIFTIYVCIRNRDYERAEDIIQMALKFTSDSRQVYASGEQNQINVHFNDVQLIVESQETLNLMLQNNSSIDQAVSIWKNRVKAFRRSYVMWDRLINLREIVYPIASNLRFYSKIVSVLREDKQFQLINKYFIKNFNFMDYPEMMIPYFKILWVMGDRMKDIRILSFIIKFLGAENFEDVKSSIQQSSVPFDFIRHFVLKHKITPEQEALFRHNFPGETNILKYFTKRATPDQQDMFVRQFLRNSIDTLEKVFHNVNNMSSRNKAKLHSLYATYSYRITFDCVNYFRISSDNFHAGCVVDPTYKRVWRGWGYANNRLFEILGQDKEENYQYALNAVQGFLNAAKLSPKDSLEFQCLIFSILFTMKSSELVPQQLMDDIVSLPSNDIVKVLPQIMAQIDHPDPVFRKMIYNILIEFGPKHFESVYYSTRFYKTCNKESKREQACEILKVLSQSNPIVTADIELFIDGMVRSAVTWFEIWIHGLETAAKLQRKNDNDGSEMVLETLFKEIQYPQCELDDLFIRLYGAFVDECWALFNEGTPNSIKMMWAKLKQLYNILKERVNKLSFILLPKVTESLAVKHGFSLSVPGRNEPGLSLESVEPVMEVLGTQQHPRCVFLIANNGERVKYLLKGNEDLRLDQRLMQFFQLANGILRHNQQIRDSEAFVCRYLILPLTPNAGLIGWVTGADTMHQMICDDREMHGTDLLVETPILREFSSCEFLYMNALQRYEFFEVVRSQQNAQELFEIMWMRAPNAALWLKRIHRYTNSTALMSMIGYIIGLGDRHPSNIMIQRETGNVVHIDFGESFESTLMRQLYAEKVPFRLTSMIINALEGSMIEGAFTHMCETVMTVLRENLSSFVAHLSIFMHEPLEEAANKEEYSYKTSPEILERIDKKLHGKENGAQATIKEQVAQLIVQAADPLNYVQHYPGWCPFW